MPSGPLPVAYCVITGRVACVQSRPMSNRSRARAAARRRARMAARGELPAEEEPTEPSTPEPQGGFLRRLLPPAPPLPGRPPPLEGFTHQGPLRPVVERLWLLARSPVAWIVPAIFWALGQLIQLANPQSTIGFVFGFSSFVAPLAAGWFGWRRPGLYGGATAFLGFVVFAVPLVYIAASQGTPLEAFGGPANLAASISIQGFLFTVMGYLLGWYGGYLRRRQASAQTERRPRR